MTSTEVILDWIRAHGAGGVPDDLGPDSKLLESGLLDSLQLVELVSFVETRFGVEVELDELTPDNFETARGVAALVDRRTGALKGQGA
jgi:acyl carrier protein